MFCTLDSGRSNRPAGRQAMEIAARRLRSRFTLANAAVAVALAAGSSAAATFAPLSGELAVRVGSEPLATSPVTYDMTSLRDDVFQGGGLSIAAASATLNVAGDRFTFRSAASSSTSSPQTPEDAGLTSWAESRAGFSQEFTTSVTRRVTLSSRVDRPTDQSHVRAAISVESEGGLKSLNLSDTEGLTAITSLLFPPGRHLIQGEISTSAMTNSTGSLTGRLSGDFSVGADDDHGYVLVTAEADLDADSRVGATDLNLWAGGFGMIEDGRFDNGDVNEDRAVDGTDFLIWQRQFGPVVSSVVAARPIPEPSAWGLLVTGTAAATITSRAGVRYDRRAAPC